MDKGAWRARVDGVTKSQTGLSDYHVNFQGEKGQKTVQYMSAFSITESMFRSWRNKGAVSWAELPTWS